MNNNFMDSMQSGIQCFQAERYTDAETHFRRALALQPSHPDAHQFLGLTLVRGGNPERGEQLIREAIRLNPNSLSARNNLASILKDLGRLQEAAAAFRELLALAPNDPTICSNLAVVLLDLDECHEALSHADRAVTLAPNWGQAHHVQGLALQDIGDIQAAAGSLRKAIALEPNNPDFNCNLSSVLIALDNLVDAERHARTALALRPAYPEAQRNLALALGKQYKTEEAVKGFEYEIQLNPTSAQAYADLATAVSDLGDAERARTLYEQALELTPDYPLARFGLSLMQLTLGDFANGWANYEARQYTPELDVAPRLPRATTWRGDALAGKHLLLYAEQGFGDTLQFVRFVPRLLEMGARVTIEIPFQMMDLIRQSRWVVDFVTETDSLTQSYDFECSMLSLPAVLKTGFDDLPGAFEYLHASPSKTTFWKQRFGDGDALRVGLCWAGRTTHKNDRNRSIPTDIFRQLGENIHARFVNLQKDATPDALASFAKLGIHLDHWADEFPNFSDTAALIANLDLVISVDTVIAHLAGALGKPTWTLIPFASDWRWLRDRDDSPWYPSMRLFRQSEIGDWTGTIARVREELSQAASCPRA